MANPDYVLGTRSVDRRAPQTPAGRVPPVAKMPRQQDCPVEGNQDCGNNGKVVGGEEACPNQFPWLALVYCDAPYGWVCTGSFLSGEYILTAGTRMSVADDADDHT